MIEIESIVNDPEMILLYAEMAAVHHPENFGRFENRVDNYIEFYVVKYNGKPAALSGIYQDPCWPSDHYRVADRSFYFPDIRRSHLHYPDPDQADELMFINSKILLPKQIEIVNKLDGVPFYSMLNHPNALKRSVRTLNKYIDDKFIVLDDVYYTCNHPAKDNPRCWQHIAVQENKAGLFAL